MIVILTCVEILTRKTFSQVALTTRKSLLTFMLQYNTIMSIDIINDENEQNLNLNSFISEHVFLNYVSLQLIKL